MAQELKVKIKGLWTAPNNWSEVPEGALKVAENVSIADDSVLRSRRGQARYGAVQSGSINKLFNYGLNHIAQVGDNALVYNEDGTTSWVSYAGTYSPPDGWRMRSVESNQNFYFTTDEGIKKIDDVTSEPFQAGVVEGLDLAFFANGNPDGWLANGASVAYRVLFGYTDENENLILGAPSSRYSFTNSVADNNPIMQVFIPDGITTSHFYQLYRTAQAAGGGDPGDEMQLVYEGFPTSSEITAGYLTVRDVVPDDLRGVALYTSPSQEGIESANFPPPVSTDIELFKGCTFYSNTSREQSATINLIAVGSATSLNALTVDGAISSGSPTVTGIADTTGVHIGMMSRHNTGIPDGALVTGFTATTITFNQNSTVTSALELIRVGGTVTMYGDVYWAHPVPGDADPTLGEFYIETADTPSANIVSTAISLRSAINRFTANDSVYAYYIDGGDVTLPGRLALKARSLGTAAFTVDSSYPEAFSPELPQTSENDYNPNRLYFSKFQQPEAVPLGQYFDVGSKNFPIQRIIASGDTLFVFKQDGIFRIIGVDSDSFRLSALDNTAIINGPETAVSVNNQVVMLSSQGIVAVSDSGVQVLSRPIEDDLLTLTSDSYQTANNYRFTSFGVGYETERTYTLWIPATKTDDYPTVGFVYNFFTQAWTTWTLPRSCGVVSQRYDQLLMGVGGEDQTALERKEYDETDFADEEYAVTVNSVSGASLTLADASDVEVGYSIVQGANDSVVTAVVGNVVTVAEAQAFTTGAATVYTPIPVYVEWQPISGKNPGVNKHFKEMTLFFKLATFDEIELEISNSFSRELAFFNIVPPTNDVEGTFGSETWGGFEWGGSSGIELREAGPAAIRTLIPLKSARALWVAFSLSLVQARRSLNMTGMSVIYDNMSTRFR